MPLWRGFGRDGILRASTSTHMQLRLVLLPERVSEVLSVLLSRSVASRATFSAPPPVAQLVIADSRFLICLLYPGYDM